MKLWDALRNSGKVIKEGLISPNKFNEPAATRFKQSIYPLAGIPGAVAETADELHKGNPGMAALAATGVIPGVGALGSIIRHGSPNILLSHGSGANSLLNLLRGKEKALEAPSMAVSKLVSPFGSDVTLYPRPQKFDPGVNPRSDLYATDAFTYRKSQEQFSPNHPPPYARSKFRKEPRLTEGYTPSEPSKLASVIASPKFKSFDQYEGDLADVGAGRLTSRRVNEDDYADFADDLRYEFESWVDNKYGATMDPEEIYRMKTYGGIPLMDDFIKENPGYKEAANSLPSEYGELKYHGMVPVDRENIAAVRLANMSTRNNDELVRALRRQGIPIVPQHMENQGEIANFVDYITGLRGDYNPRLEKIIATKGSIDLNDVAFEKVGPIMIKYGIPGDDLGMDAQSYLSFVAKELTKKGASGKELDAVVKAMKAAQKKQR